ncbi:hypothetical protein EV644_105270 [Kribbella orskensis]|uniref:Cysteinyl-tRNA ligase anticodon binding domain-containing protein n=1 Tax=Kribbella orskensis TaxID=2512216 RepID=A0ABY2BLJ1_9ACTN|nr:MULTISPECIES: hypothetical protein [Kribbella]TCN40985.1 hypothetical protein EV642_104270 [Kribbella sp. VKM Ac-2500]TCO24237.1 hypothetical protein EV644_105270 [Kribbella orskensis]
MEDDPELPPAVNAALKARSKAFALGDKGKPDVRELREEGAKLGYTVRDEDKRQYWCPTTPDPHPQDAAPRWSLSRSVGGRAVEVKRLPAMGRMEV